MSRADPPAAAPAPIESFALLPLLADDPAGQPGVETIPPTGVVPFALADAEARDRFEGWMAKKRPIGSRQRAVVEAVRPVYVPCWTFTAQVRVPWRAMKMRSKRRRAAHDDSSYERVPIDGVVDRTFDEIVPATSLVPAELVAGLDPAPAEELIPCAPDAAADPLVAPCTVSLREAWDRVDARLQGEVTLAVQRDAGLTATDLESWPEWSGQRCRQVLAPFYVVEYRFGGERFVALVHGRSGAVDGQRPADWIARVLAGAIVLGTLAGLGWLVISVVRWVF